MNLTTEMDEVTLQLCNKDWFYYANSALGFISTVALIVLLLLTTLTMALDIIYLQLPGAKLLYTEFLENKKGNKFARGAVRLLVSKTAIQSFEEATQKSVPVMWVYMKNSIKHYIFVTILIVILATGLDTILLIVYKLIRGFLAQL